ncbi:MAG: hypothetical protein NTW49_03890, partial [Bacteroidia bacterium]|nr:hypothetical protein [Bacteroidia bacterium]
RQEFSYDNERLLSAGNWQQKGMTHDAALFKYHTNGWKIDFAAAFNQTGDPIFGTTYTGTSVKGNYKTLNFLWINKKFGQLNCSVLAIMDGFNQSPLKNTTYLRKTAGAILKYNIDGVTIALRGFSQMGNDSTGTKISAYYLNPDLFFGVKNCMFNPGMEYVSGNDYTDASNKKLNVFSTLYGSGHAFMGNMDYFCDMQKDTKSAGLIDIYLKTFYKLNEKTMLKADLHYFSLQNKYVDQTTGKTIDKPLGEELDLNCKYDMSKDVSMQFGYSVFSGTESNVIIRKGAITGFSGGGEEGKLGHWAFVMFTIKPTLFSSK